MVYKFFDFQFYNLDFRTTKLQIDQINRFYKAKENNTWDLIAQHIKKMKTREVFVKGEKKKRENRKKNSRTLLYKLKNWGNVIYRASGNYYIGKIQRKKEKKQENRKILGNRTTKNQS